MKPDPEAFAQALRPAPPEGVPPPCSVASIVLPYYPLSAPPMLQGIVRLQLDRIKQRIEQNRRDRVRAYDQGVVDLIVSRCDEVASGGRVIDAILTNTMLPELSIELLNRQMSGAVVSGIAIGTDGKGFPL